jgi:hypothetical protein
MAISLLVKVRFWRQSQALVSKEKQRLYTISYRAHPATHPESGVTASICPDHERPPAEQERLRGFKSRILALNFLADTIKSAADFIVVGKDSLPFSKDVLCVEVSGPTQPLVTFS